MNYDLVRIEYGGLVCTAFYWFADDTVMFRLLRQLRKNRDDEAELMKNVPGWITGTLWGEPTSKRVRGQFPQVHPEAYFAHNRAGDMYDHLTERKWHWTLTEDERFWPHTTGFWFVLASCSIPVLRWTMVLMFILCSCIATRDINWCVQFVRNKSLHLTWPLTSSDIYHDIYQYFHSLVLCE